MDISRQLLRLKNRILQFTVAMYSKYVIIWRTFKHVLLWFRLLLSGLQYVLHPGAQNRVQGTFLFFSNNNPVRYDGLGESDWHEVTQGSSVREAGVEVCSFLLSLTPHWLSSIFLLSINGFPNHVTKSVKSVFFPAFSSTFFLICPADWSWL